MRSNDIKVHRTDGSADTDKDERLIRVRAAIHGLPFLATRVVLLHDHKGCLSVHHLEELSDAEQRFVRAVWEANGEPGNCVEFVHLWDGLDR